MFGALKFLWLVCSNFRALLNVNRNSLAHVPNPTKYLAMIMLSCFWCAAFGLYFGELITIGYNMIGHVAVITMAVVTPWTFKKLSNNHNQYYLRSTDGSSRCDEYSDEQRQALAKNL